MSETTSQFPGVFRGNTRLASQQDIAALKEYVERLIAGPINELETNGYIPWKYTTDGTLDIEYLFPELLGKIEEKTGIVIKNGGIQFAEGISAINFQGKYVSLDIDENGCLVCNIDEPSIKVPNFNEANSFGDAIVKIDNELVDDMIVPYPSPSSSISVYGDWEPGQKVQGLNAQNRLYDILSISTNGPVYAVSISTYFEVKVTDGNGAVLASFISVPIKSDTSTSGSLAAASVMNSPYIKIYISDMLEEATGYSFKPRFEINLAKIIGEAGGRFNVSIIHHNGGVPYTYTSKDLLYNVGTIPSMTTPSIQLMDDESNPSGGRLTTNWCSGIKYVSNGTVFVRLNKVYNLNNMAAVDDPVEYDFPIAGRDESQLIAEDYDYTIDKVAAFKIRMKLNVDSINNENVTGSIVLKNAFGRSQKYIVNVPVLLNSQTSPEFSNSLTECFSDESHRVLHDFEIDDNIIGEYSSFIPWDSTKSLLEYDDGRGLMVVPGVGLQYPSGDWSKFEPAGNPNYDLPSFAINEKYFARVFSGNTDVKFGGVFKFDGLTKEEFNDDRLSIVVSYDQGRSWLNLKAIRNMHSIVLKDDNASFRAEGIMTEIEEYDGGIFVHWAYPTNVQSEHSLIFKLGMKPTSPFCIKKIQLLNADKEENW